MKDLKPLLVTKTEAKELLHGISRYHYVKSLNFTPYDWQTAVLKSEHRRKSINGARQSGKSTIVSSIPCHKAKYYPGSVSIILAATEQQAFYVMEKVKEFIGLDQTYPEKERVSDRLITLKNGSWIMVVPATDKSARGVSAPDLILLDEASRIEDIVYKSGVISMLNDNPECELILISTPNGKSGFFFESQNNPNWERYEVRSPWEVVDLEARLIEAEPEEEYRKKCEEKGIRGHYSPRHKNKTEQEFNLNEMGIQMYKQEYNVEFVEAQDQIFTYSEVERMFNGNAEPLNIEEIGEGESFY